MAGGRPTKYQPEMCETVISLGKQGASRAEVCFELDISFQTLRNWEESNPEFLEATTRARELSNGWWAKQGRLGIWSREFNANAYRLQVMNRFPDDWRDRQEVKHSGSIATPQEMSDEELVQRHAELRNRVAAAFSSEEFTTNGNGSHG